MRKSVAALSLAAVSPVLFWMWPPAAIATSFVGAHWGVMGQGSLNVLATRAVALIAVLLHGGIVAGASGEPLLGAAVAAAMVPMTLIGPTLVRRFGYRVTMTAVAAVPASLALIAAAWPFDWWGLSVVPSLFVSSRLGLDVIGQVRRRRSFGRPQWGVRIGDNVPDFRLPSRDGRTEFHLASERGRFVMILFVRSDWCPVCHVQLRIFQKESARLAQKNVRIVAIGTAHGDSSVELTRLMGIDYLVLVDEACRVASLFDAVQPGLPPGAEVPLPASFLIDPDGILCHSSRPDDIGSFEDPGRILEVLDRAAAKHLRASA